MAPNAPEVEEAESQQGGQQQGQQQQPQFNAPRQGQQQPQQLNAQQQAQRDMVPWGQGRFFDGRGINFAPNNVRMMTLEMGDFMDP